MNKATPKTQGDDIPLEERQQFALWSFAWLSFNQVVDACDHLIKPPPQFTESALEVFAFGLVATYAKPFTACHQMGKLQPDVVPREHLSTHTSLMHLRHKVVAHLDASHKQSNDPLTGNLVHVRIKLTSTDYECVPVRPPINELNLNWKDVKHLSSILRDKADHHRTRFAERYLSILQMHGDYRLNTEPGQPTFTRIERA